MFFSGTPTLQLNRQAKAINERNSIILAFTAKRDLCKVEKDFRAQRKPFFRVLRATVNKTLGCPSRLCDDLVFPAQLFEYLLVDNGDLLELRGKL